MSQFRRRSDLLEERYEPPRLIRPYSARASWAFIVGLSAAGRALILGFMWAVLRGH